MEDFWKTSKEHQGMKMPDAKSGLERGEGLHQRRFIQAWSIVWVESCLHTFVYKGVGVGDTLREIPLGSSAFKWRFLRSLFVLRYHLLSTYKYYDAIRPDISYLSYKVIQ